jgi:hypothetical protein
MILYAKIAAAVIAIGLAYWAGYDRMRDKHLLFVAEVQAVGEAQEAANQHAVEVAEIISEAIKNEYELKIAGLRSKYANAGRVCDNGSGRSNVSKNAGPSTKPYDPTTDPEFIMKCSETTAQLVTLQKWLIQQQEHQK